MRIFIMCLLAASFFTFTAMAAPLEGNWMGKMQIQNQAGEITNLNCKLSIAVVGNYVHFIDTSACTYMPITMKLQGTELYLGSDLVGELTETKLSFHQSAPPKFEYNVTIELQPDGSIQFNDHYTVPSTNTVEDGSGNLAIRE